jgi:L-2,4-diaminobutyrate decarboxylase
MNNSTTVYELAMVGNTMEKVIIEHLAGKFGYDGDSEGFVTSGGSLGNLTAILKARSSSGIDSKDYSRLAIMVSEEAHYSVERAASILGVSRDNIVKVPSDESFRIRTDLLEGIYREAVAAGKLVFCVVGCACTTSVGAYDDLAAIADFAQAHGIWFHVDGAHGGAAIFSDKYRHYLDGVEHSDSLVLDFHKMMLVPSISTAVIFNARNRGANAFSPKADYLWQAGGSGDWYDAAKHTLECTKPITVLHAYAIMRMYGEEIYQQHIDKLYDLGRSFADMVKGQAGMELAVEPSCNIVCFRCLSGAGADEDDRLNKRIYEELLEEGLFYIVSTTIRGRFYLRVSLMNPMTDAETLEELLKAVVKRAV